MVTQGPVNRVLRKPQETVGQVEDVPTAWVLAERFFSGPFLWRIHQHNYLVGGSFFLVWGALSYAISILLKGTPVLGR